MDLFNLLNDMEPEYVENNDSRDKNIVRAPFGYPGGKDKSVKIILDHLPVRDVFVDHCGGSGIITMNRPKSKKLDVYNDRWSGVTAFYRCVRNDQLSRKLLDSINLTMHSREEFVYAKENWENPALDDVERATLFYIMLSHSFGKLGRNWARALNSNVGFARVYDLPYWDQLKRIFKQKQIENQDLLQCLSDYNDQLGVHYIDPPYLKTDTGIYKWKFTQADHINFLEFIFNKGKGFYAVSGYPNEIYNAYPWDEVHKWEVKVTIDSQSSTPGGNREYDGSGRNSTTECLFIKEIK